MAPEIKSYNIETANNEIYFENGSQKCFVSEHKDVNEIPSKTQVLKAEDIKSKINVSVGDSNLSYNYLWLRDNCRCCQCYNHLFTLRSVHLLDIPEDIKPNTAFVENGKLRIVWADGHNSEYSAEFLLKHNYKAWIERQKRKLVFWRGNEVKDKVAAVEYDDFMKTDEAMKKVLESVMVYGLAFVDGVEPTEAEMERFTRRIGPPQATLFGVTWNISTENDVFQDAAFTNNKITFHTDTTYFSESCGLLLLHILQPAIKGGETVLIDTFETVKRLEKSHPKDVEILATKKITTEYHEKGYSFRHSSPIIKYNEYDGEPEHIRFNINDRTPFTSIPEEETLDYYKALRRFASEFENKESQWWFALKPGRVLIVDNWRLLHGRSEFLGKRFLSGSFVSRSDWTSKARTLGLID